MINIYSAVMLILLLIPNVIYFQRLRKNGTENVRKRNEYSSVEIVEQIGRYGSMIFLTVNIGFLEYGFSCDAARWIWIAVAAVIIAVYYAFWILLFKKSPKRLYKVMLAVLPSVLFVLSGIIMRRFAGAFFGAVFAASHIYITSKKNVD